MHELAITQNVVDAVVDHVGGRTVTAVHLCVGQLSGVVPDAMRFCYEMVTESTPLAGSDLDIEQPAGQAFCRTCQRDFAVDDLILLCDCGSADVEVVSGRELRVTSVDVV